MLTNTSASVLHSHHQNYRAGPAYALKLIGWVERGACMSKEEQQCTYEEAILVTVYFFWPKNLITNQTPGGKTDYHGQKKIQVHNYAPVMSLFIYRVEQTGGANIMIMNA